MPCPFRERSRSSSSRRELSRHKDKSVKCERQNLSYHNTTSTRKTFGQTAKQVWQRILKTYAHCSERAVSCAIGGKKQYVKRSSRTSLGEDILVEEDYQDRGGAKFINIFIKKWSWKKHKTKKRDLNTLVDSPCILVGWMDVSRNICTHDRTYIGHFNLKQYPWDPSHCGGNLEEWYDVINTAHVSMHTRLWMPPPCVRTMLAVARGAPHRCTRPVRSECWILRTSFFKLKYQV